MKYQSFFTVVLCACFSTCLIVFPSAATEGAVNGMKLCYTVIIPSLFPFAVCSLILFDSNALNFLSAVMDKPSRKLFSLNGKMFTVFLISCIGGYPVGAKLIEKAYVQGEISKKSAGIMLGYCVNSGPSFIIIAVGSGILGSHRLGALLFVSNLLASLLLAFMSSRLIEPQKNVRSSSIHPRSPSDQFVSATYEASNSMIGICSFVVLFSAILGLIENVFPSGAIKTAVCALLEITNGIAHSDKNIFVISFMLGFAGFCVHFQVLSMCKELKPNYIAFLLYRIAHGVASALLTYAAVKLFKISIPAVSLGQEYPVYTSQYSLLFSIALLLLSVCFMLSVRKNFKTL